MEDLYPSDAGTDSGLSYNVCEILNFALFWLNDLSIFLNKSPNRPTIPQEKIKKISSMFPNDPLAPFYDPSGKQMPPVAKLYLKREKLNGAQCPNGIVESKETDSIQSSRLFDSQDLSDPIRRNQLIAMETNNLIKKNRQKSKEMKFIGTFRIIF